MDMREIFMAFTYKTTMKTCFVGYVVQAAVNNFAPLLFLTFQRSYNISLSKIALLVSFNFVTQLVIDLISAVVVDKIGYKRAVCAAHVFCAAGFILMSFLPDIMPDPFVGLVISIMVYAVGGGLIEVLISPIVENCPTDNKEQAMSMLHSFYCWGQMGVVLLSTLFFAAFGVENWKLLSLIWALLPAANGVMFYFAPVPSPEADEEGIAAGIKKLFKMKMFWIFVLLMFCAGACELAVSQWASTFAEKALGVSKTVGDLAGPMLFAVTMGTARAFYGKYGDKIRLERFMIISCIACLAAYAAIALSPLPVIGFAGCALCGASVGIMWPGTFSMAAKDIKGGGTVMFAFLALAGDLGCSGGPFLVGMVSDAAGGSLNKGIAAAIVFPLLMLAGIMICKHTAKKS